MKKKDASNLGTTAEINFTVKDIVTGKKDDRESTDSESSDDQTGFYCVETTHKHGDAHDSIISGEGLSESPERTDAGLTPQLQQQDHHTDDHTSAVGRKSQTHDFGTESGQSLISKRGEERGNRAVSSDSSKSQVTERYSEESNLKEVSNETLKEVSNETENKEHRAEEFTGEKEERSKGLVLDKSTEEISLKQVSNEKELISSAENREQREEIREDSEIPTNSEETEERQKGKVESQRNSPPRPAQRRSVRQRKAPAWFESYQMKQMVVRPYDNRLESLNVLLNSGVLGELDSEIAHKIIRSLME